MTLLQKQRKRKCKICFNNRLRWIIIQLFAKVSVDKGGETRRIEVNSYYFQPHRESNNLGFIINHTET